MPDIKKSLSHANGSNNISFSGTLDCWGIAKGVRIFPLYSRICKYEFLKRSLYLYWDNFKQSVSLQGFYQFYYTFRDTNGLRVRWVELSASVLTKRSKMAFHLPKIFSQVAQIIFYDRKHSKTKTSPQNVFLLIRMAQEKQRRKTGLRWKVAESGGKWKSRLELLSECTKLRVDEKLVAPDPDMFGYRTFVVIRLQNLRSDFNHYESLWTFCSRTCTVPLFKGLRHGAKLRRFPSYTCE